MTDVEKLNQFMNLLNGSFAVLGADDEIEDDFDGELQISVCDFEDTYIPLVGFEIDREGVLFNITYEFEGNDGAYTLKESEVQLKRLAEVAADIDRCYILAYGHQPKYSWSNDGEDSDQ